MKKPLFGHSQDHFASLCNFLLPPGKIKLTFDLLSTCLPENTSKMTMSLTDKDQL